ncbi:MAG: flagellar basal-body rod protein FlgB [Planctomycetota bacterium]|jgi:flagellar basal-body rod protein FlgB
MDVLGSQGQLLLRLLSSAQENARVVAGNISNQNTPGYKRREHSFETLLADEMQSSTPDLAGIQPTTTTDELSPARGDGNNVVLENEINNLRETVVRYELYASMLKNRANLIRSAIHGER